MKGLVILVAGVFVAASLFWLAAPPRATAAQPTGGYVLSPPNTAENPATGNTIRVAGSGSFNAEGGTVVASGAFRRFTPAGAVIDKGTWEATDFVNFVSFGGPNPGFQGGELSLAVTLFPKGGDPEPGTPMNVFCCIRADPPCSTLPFRAEGTTVGSFTEKTGGVTLFNLRP